MAYLSNTSINRLNLHLALVNLLDQSYTVFGPIYLYTRGFSIPSVLGLLALINFLRMPLRLLAFPIIRRWGLKTTIMMGATGYGLSFPLLGQVTGFDHWLFLYIPFCSFFCAIHWLAFHTLYSMAGEQEKRGRQVATAYAMTAAFSAIAPLLGSFAIMETGFKTYFLGGFIIVASMLLTLRQCENIPLPPIHWRDGKKAFFSLGAKIHLLESSSYYPFTVCWVFVVYVYVEKIVSFGSIIAFGVVAQIIYQLLLGSLVDRGKGTLITNAAESLRMLATLGRAFLPLSFGGILGIETIAAAGSVHHNAVQPTAIYNAGKQYPHPLWYWLFAEMGWDIGTVIGAGGAALLLWQGVELRHVILIALPFISILWWLLNNYFKRYPNVQPIA